MTTKPRFDLDDRQSESVNLKLIIQTILEDYALPIYGDHGVSHWARVLENGRRLSETTGANVAITLRRDEHLSIDIQQPRQSSAISHVP